MPSNRVHSGVAALATLLGLAAALGVSSATATGSSLTGGSQQGGFKIAWTHNNGPFG